MLHALAGGVCVVADRGANTGDFVGGDAGPDAATADDDAAPCLGGGHSFGDGFGEVREIVQGIEGVCPHVVNLVAEGLQEWEEMLLQLKAAVVGTEGEFFSC